MQRLRSDNCEVKEKLEQESNKARKIIRPADCNHIHIEAQARSIIDLSFNPRTT